MRLGRGSFSSQRHGIRYFAFFTETKWQTFRGIPGFYSTSGAVDYTAVIFCAHLVAVKCEVFTTTSTREIQLCTRPATQLTCSPYFRQISHASPLRVRENLSERGRLKTNYIFRKPSHSVCLLSFWKSVHYVVSVVMLTLCLLLSSTISLEQSILQKYRKLHCVARPICF